MGISQRTFQCFDQAVERFLKAEAEVLQHWKSPCQCELPGGKWECLECVYCRDLIDLIQKQLSSESEEVFPELLPPEIEPPFSEEVQQQCLDLWRNGYTLKKIIWLTGVNNRRLLRKWLTSENLMGGAADYSEAEKQLCIELYLEGKTPSEIEDQTGISGEIISEWVQQAGVSRPKTCYTKEQKESCLSLYLEGKTLPEVEHLTGVPGELVRCWAKLAHLKRPRRRATGRPRVYPPEVREQCKQLLEEGKTPVQVAHVLGVTADAVRRWSKEGFNAQKNTDADLE